MLFSAVVSRYTRTAATLDMSAAYVQRSMDSGPCLRQGLVFRMTGSYVVPAVLLTGVAVAAVAMYYARRRQR
jgi:hypothetical protein